MQAPGRWCPMRCAIRSNTHPTAATRRGDAGALVSRLRDWLSAGLPSPVDVSPWYAGPLVPVWAELLASAQMEAVSYSPHR